MKRICPDCQNRVAAWFDYFHGAGPILRWRQLNPRRSPEIRTAHVNDRAALIRRQVENIRANCDHEVAA